MNFALFFVYLAFMTSLLVGWVLNIIDIATSFNTFETGEQILRVAGIIIPIIGSFFGLFG